MPALTIRCRVQHALVTGQRAEDEGEFVFVMCRRGLSEAMGRLLRPGEQMTIRVTIDEVGNDESPVATDPDKVADDPGAGGGVDHRQADRR